MSIRGFLVYRKGKGSCGSDLVSRGNCQFHFAGPRRSIEPEIDRLVLILQAGQAFQDFLNLAFPAGQLFRYVAIPQNILIDNH